MTKSKLSEELSKVINDHMETSFNQEQLQKLSLGHDSVKQSINDLKESFDEKINELKNELKNEMKSLEKIRRLEWAIEQGYRGSYKSMYRDDYPIHVEKGSKIVRKILLAFRKNCGYGIDEFYIQNGSNYVSQGKGRSEEEYKNFEIAISEQIHLLTGVKPRIAICDGKKSIFYS
jgi:hypothetical protein